jgi:hypothetical protein
VGITSAYAIAFRSAPRNPRRSPKVHNNPNALNVLTLRNSRTSFRRPFILFTRFFRPYGRRYVLQCAVHALRTSALHGPAQYGPNVQKLLNSRFGPVQ